jgi:CRP/FNR family transcriptional regulator
MFNFLTEEELYRVNQTRLTVVFNKGETIRKQGTYLSHVLMINKGLAKLYLEGPDQRNSIIRIVQPTNFIGGPGIYLDNLHHFSVAALTETTVCFIDVQVFRELVDSNHQFAHEFMKDFSRNVLSVYKRMINLTQKQMPGRMADALLYLFDEIFNSTRIPMLLSRNDLAELSGMSKDSAVKTLRDFQQDGIIEINERELALLNADALNRISKLG